MRATSARPAFTRSRRAAKFRSMPPAITSSACACRIIRSSTMWETSTSRTRAILDKKRVHLAHWGGWPRGNLGSEGQWVHERHVPFRGWPLALCRRILATAHLPCRDQRRWNGGRTGSRRASPTPRCRTVALDIAGDLYISLYNPNIIYRFTRNGELITLYDDWEQLKLVAPTNIAFGGEDMSTLMIASLCGWSIHTAPMAVPGLRVRYPKSEPSALQPYCIRRRSQ